MLDFAQMMDDEFNHLCATELPTNKNEMIEFLEQLQEKLIEAHIKCIKLVKIVYDKIKEEKENEACWFYKGNSK